MTVVDDAAVAVDDPIISAENVTLRFGGVTSLANVTLAQQRGEILAVIGPNGAGKTSLFNLIAGALQPDAGAIRLDGRDITRASTQARARTGRTGIAPRMSRLSLPIRRPEPADSSSINLVSNANGGEPCWISGVQLLRV